MERRRYLLSIIASAFKWLAYKFTYLYNSIIPNSVSGKQVLNKARLKTIEGNSVVENQLVNTNTSTITLTNGHKYLTYVNGTWSYVNGTNQTLSVSGGTDMVIDLTQMFPFDTPSTLTDNRVQALINRGYIPYNVGEIKNSVVSEITCTRLPKEYQEVEYIKSTGTQYIDTNYVGNQDTNAEAKFSLTAFNTDGNNIVSSGLGSSTIRCFLISTRAENNNYAFRLGYGTELVNSTLEAQLNTIYNAKTQITGSSQKLFINGEEVCSSSSTQSFTSSKLYLFASNVSSGDTAIYLSKLKLYSCKLYNGTTLVRNFVPCYRKSDNVIGLFDTVNQVFYTNQGTGTFLKGNDVSNIGTISLPAPLEIAGVGTAHDTFEVLKDSYRFTRNVFDVDLGSLSWSYNNANRYIANPPSDLKSVGYSEQPNWLCETKIPMPNNVSLTDYQNAICYYLSKFYTYASSGSEPTPTGMLSYQLATPQVVNIPKKHLGAVDLGNIGLSLSGGYWRGIVSNIKSPSSTTMPNIYCAEYMNDIYAHLQSNGYIAISDNGYVYIKDSTKTQASDFNGIILFYETNAETTDFVNETNIESGGTLNSDSNVLPNVEMLLKCK